MKSKDKKIIQDLFALLQEAFFLIKKNLTDTEIKEEGDTLSTFITFNTDFAWNKASRVLKERFADLIESLKKDSTLGTLRLDFKKEGSTLTLKSSEHAFIPKHDLSMFGKEYMEMLEILAFRNTDHAKVQSFIREKLSDEGISFCYHPLTSLDLKALINSKNLPLKDIDVADITDFSYAFSVNDAHGQVEINRRRDFSGIENWNTSKAVNMMGVFAGCENFNADISKWDTSNVTDMTLMFTACKKFNQNITAWNTSKCTKMKATFYKCENFNQDISGWDTSQVRDMSLMFAYCKKLDCDLSKLDTSKVIHDENIFLESLLKDEYRPKLPGNDFKRQYYEKYVGPKSKSILRTETLKRILLCLGFIGIVVFVMMFSEQ